ncbi:hypothetical protein [Brumicola blandensis]|uniref:Uncharacterized protein n=1 Tax=Brumicola blandensis TaxID=3075611 RepID=A0AAW8QX25_9ALTE|nr:hypothetical protein [Alteromonas sp. W409]MDT0581536.1 hypothetical protein [Alteromonas sp. W409]
MLKKYDDIDDVWSTWPEHLSKVKEYIKQNDKLQDKKGWCFEEAQVLENTRDKQMLLIIFTGFDTEEGIALRLYVVAESQGDDIKIVSCKRSNLLY